MATRQQSGIDSSMITKVFVTIASALFIGVGSWVGISTVNNTVELTRNTEAVKTNIELLKNLTTTVNKNADAIQFNSENIRRNSEKIREVDGKVEALKLSKR